MKNHTITRCIRTFLTAAFLILSVFLLSACGKEANSAYSPEIPDKPEHFYVYDTADVLDTANEAYLVAQNEALFALTGAQIITVCVPDTGTLNISDYANQLFNKWNVGSAERNNGVLLLLSIDADTYWLLPGKGVADTLTSSVLKDLNNQYLEPHFAKKEYAQGVRALFDALLSHMESLYSADVDAWSGAAGAFTQDRTPPQTTEKKSVSPAVRIVMILLLTAIAVLTVAILVIVRRGRSRGRRRKSYAAVSRVPIRTASRNGYYPGTVPPPRTGTPRQTPPRTGGNADRR